MRITAFGDLHLDSAFSAYTIRNSGQRREMLRKIFSNIISLVKENKSDLLLICGDLFDVTAPTPESLTHVRRELASLSIPVFITPGNHDCYIENGIYDDMPDNVHVFKSEELESVIIESAGVCIDGYAFTSDTYSKNPLSSYKKAEQGIVHILCAHTDMIPGSKYAPFTKDDLEETDYALAALGHVHTKNDLLQAGSCTAVYSGVIQGRGFDEPINGYVNVIDIDSSGIYSIERLDMSLWNNLIYQISVDDAVSDTEILSRINIECMNNSISEYDTIRIELVGEYDFKFSPNFNYITSETKKIFGKEDVFIKNYSSPKLDRELLLSDPSVAGVLYRTLFDNPDFINAYPEDIRIRAFNLSMKALTGNDIDPENI